MKDKTGMKASTLRRAEKSLFEAVSCVESASEAEDFLRDLCTPAELQALVDRWAVVGLLREGMTYRDINAKTGVSVTTVGRVARFLEDGHGGYQAVIDRLES